MNADQSLSSLQAVALDLILMLPETLITSKNGNKKVTTFIRIMKINLDHFNTDIRAHIPTCTNT